MPESIKNYNFYLWLYVSDVSKLSADCSGGGVIEISKEIDITECEWSLPDLNIVNGWNCVCLSMKNAPDNFDVINYLRVATFSVGDVTIKVDGCYLCRQNDSDSINIHHFDSLDNIDTSYNNGVVDTQNKKIGYGCISTSSDSNAYVISQGVPVRVTPKQELSNYNITTWIYK